MLQILIFVFGTIVGSFFNVVLLRKNSGETVVSGRSRCFSCNQIIVWYDNIPIISFVMLGGRCRLCQSKISRQYPLIEALTGFLAVVVFLKTATIPSFLFYFGVFASLFLMAAYDARTKIIDTGLLFIFACFALIASFMRWDIYYFSGSLIAFDIISAALMWFFFWGLWYLSDGIWMGRGDSLVVLWCALLIGFPLSMGALLMSFWIGGLFGGFLLIASQIKKTAKHKGQDILKMEIPFAPFLALGTFTAWYFAGFFRLFFSLLW